MFGKQTQSVHQTNGRTDGHLLLGCLRARVQGRVLFIRLLACVLNGLLRYSPEPQADNLSSELTISGRSLRPPRILLYISHTTTNNLTQLKIRFHRAPLSLLFGRTCLFALVCRRANGRATTGQLAKD